MSIFYSEEKNINLFPKIESLTLIITDTNLGKHKLPKAKKNLDNYSKV